MHAYVINLARSVDRRAHVLSELAKTTLSYQLVEAREGRDLDLDDPLVLDPSLREEESAHGMTGCALSHLDAYRSIIADGRRSALVLEDDALLPSDLGELAEEIGTRMRGAEVVLLRLHVRPGYDVCQLSTWGMEQLGASHRLVFPFDIAQVVGGGAYVITREACERLAEVVQPVRAHADSWAHFHALDAIDSVRAVVPPVVLSDPKFRSTIERYEPETLQGRVRAHVARRRTPVLYQALAARRRRVLRRRSRTELVDLRPPWLRSRPDTSYVHATPKDDGG